MKQASIRGKKAITALVLVLRFWVKLFIRVTVSISPPACFSENRKKLKCECWLPFFKTWMGIWSGLKKKFLITLTTYVTVRDLMGNVFFFLCIILPNAPLMHHTSNVIIYITALHLSKSKKLQRLSKKFIATIAPILKVLHRFLHSKRR